MHSSLLQFPPECSLQSWGGMGGEAEVPIEAAQLSDQKSTELQLLAVECVFFQGDLWSRAGPDSVYKPSKLTYWTLDPANTEQIADCPIKRPIKTASSEIWAPS